MKPEKLRMAKVKKREPNRTPAGALACAFIELWQGRAAETVRILQKGSEPMATKRMAKAKKTKPTTAHTNETREYTTNGRRPGRPRSQPLPGLEDRAIKPLEDIAASYAEVRDRRMELNKEETELKVHALQLMKKHGKTIYRRDGIEIRIVPGEDDVKVRVQKPDEEEVEDRPDDDEIAETAAIEADGAEADE